MYPPCNLFPVFTLFAAIDVKLLHYDVLQATLLAAVREKQATSDASTGHTEFLDAVVEQKLVEESGLDKFSDGELRENF